MIMLLIITCVFIVVFIACCHESGILHVLVKDSGINAKKRKRD